MKRTRKKEKELNPKREFNAMICSDNWRNDFMRNNSLRSGFSLEHQIKQIKALNGPEPNYRNLHTQLSQSDGAQNSFQTEAEIFSERMMHESAATHQAIGMSNSSLENLLGKSLQPTSEGYITVDN
mmetsp:Transcript_21991/g.34145  ORF Transcript_21991/g.34145 Transcript_21991/m.34145 type:complete len:126 (+) Transcript_21991:984-1361(+)